MSSQESNSFDKIIRENLESFIMHFADRFLGISIQESTPINADLLTTIEREPDFIRLVKADQQKDYILHIEFQSSDNSEMAYRMAEYKAILLRKFKIPIVQYVVYLGDGKSKMATQLPEDQQISGYELRNFSEVPFEDFLNAADPEAVIMALLSDFQNQAPEWAVERILLRLKQICRHEDELKKYLIQLNVMSRLRKLENLVYQKIEAMPITFDIKEDTFYKKGHKEGLEQGLEQGMERGVEQGIQRGVEQGLEQGEARKGKKVIIKMIQLGKYSLEEIALITDTSLEYVQSIKEELDSSTPES